MRIRLIAGFGLAAVALVGMTACRSNPAVAAYVGDQTITEARVTQLVDGFVADAETAGQQVEEPSRTAVVHLLVRDEVCRQLQQKLGFPVTEPSIPAGENELLVIQAKANACQRGLPAGSPVQPTEQQAREVYDIGVRNGLYTAGQEAEAIPALMNNEGLAAAFGKKQGLEASVQEIPVTINPKYGAVELPLVSFEGGVPAVSFRFGSGDAAGTVPPVIDGPLPAPTATAPAQ